MGSSIVCRSCLTTISLEYIDLETPLYNDATFLDLLNYCTKLQAKLDDELPKNICVSCGKSLQIAYEFIKTSIEADKELRKSLSYFGDFRCAKDEENANRDMTKIIKKEIQNDDQEFNLEYIDETVDIKEEETEYFDKLEVVISNEDEINKEHSEIWSARDEENSNFATQMLEDDCSGDNTNTKYDETCKCQDCDEQLSCEESLEFHSKTIHKLLRKRENYICGWCGEAFNSRSKLCKHRIADHHGKVPSSCLTCGENCSSESDLRAHVKKAHGVPKKPVVCPYCNKEFKGIALHIKSNHPDILGIPMPDNGNAKLSKNQCPYCFRHYQSKNMLNDHLNTHTGERPYSCSICGKTYHKKVIRDRHELVVHQSKDFPKVKCDQCDFSTSNIHSLRSHKHRHGRPVEKRYLCAYCPMKFINPKMLHMHEDFKHGNAEKAFKCDICDKKFFIKRKLKEHKLCVHVKGRPHVCGMCKKTFKNDFQLKAHQKLHTDRQIDCPQCDKKFARQVDLKIHMRTHTGELPYECHLCEKRYAIKVRLTYHLQKHMGIKHKCQHCASEFNSRSKLRLHMFKHIGMPYVCDLCQMGYPNRVGLRRHSKSAHKIILSADDLLQNRIKNEKNVMNPNNILNANASYAQNDIEI